MRVKKCRVCKSEFTPARPLQSVCSAECGLTNAKVARSKAERIEAQESRKIIRLQKEKLKTRSDYIREAQIAFNAYIRERDTGKQCICCDSVRLEAGAIGGGFDAGHYRSVGSAPHLRFDESNCHGQSKRCNRYGAGRAVDYRRGLINRIGMEEVERLEADNEPRKWTIEELKDIKATYKQKLKELKCKN